MVNGNKLDFYIHNTMVYLYILVEVGYTTKFK